MHYGESEVGEPLFQHYTEHVTVLFCGAYPHSDYTRCIADGRAEGPALVSCESSKTATHCWTTVNRRMLDPTEERYPPSKGKGEAPGRWQERCNQVQNQTPHPSETLGGLKQTLCAPEPRGPSETDRAVSEYLAQRYESAVACRKDGGSGCSRPGYGRSPLGGDCH